MANYSDGNIIIDTKIDTKGAEKGAGDLARTMRELTITIKEIGTEVTKSINTLNKSLDKASKNMDGMQKSAERNADAMKTATSEAQKQAEALNTATESARSYADGNERLVTTINEVSEAQNKPVAITKEMNAAQKEVEKLQNRLFGLYERKDKLEATGTNPNTKTFKNLEYDIDTVERKLDMAIAKRDELANDNGFRFVGETGEGGHFEAIASQMMEAEEKEQEFIGVSEYLKKTLIDTAYAVTHPIESLERLKNELSNIPGVVERAGSALVELGRKTGTLSFFGGVMQKIGGKPLALITSFVDKVRGIGNESKRAERSSTQSFDNIGRSMRRGFMTMLKYTLGIRSLYILFNRLRGALTNGIKDITKYSNATNQSVSSMVSSLNYLKASFASAFAPIVNVVGPYISAFIDMIADAINYVGMFIAVLTGSSTYVRAKKVQTDYAASLDKTAGATKDAADATKKANEEANKYMSSLDEINKFQEDNDDKNKGGSGSGGGGGAGGGGAGDMFETVEIPGFINDWAERFKKAWEDADFTEFGKILADKVNEGMKWVLDHEGEIMETSHKIAKSIATFLNGFVEELNWKDLGKIVGVGINTAMEFSNTFLEEFHFQSLGKGISEGVQSAFEKIDWGQMTRFVSNVIKSSFDFVAGLIDGIDWGKLPGDLKDALKEAIDGIDFEGIAFSFGNLAGVIVKNIKEAIDEHGGIVEIGKDILKGIFTGISDIPTMWELVKTFVNNIIEGFRNGLDTHSPSKHPDIIQLGIDIVGGIFNGIGEEIAKLPSFLVGKIKELGKQTIDNIEVKIDFIKGKVEDGIEKMKETISRKIDFIKGKVEDGVEKMKDTISRKIDFIKGSVSSAIDDMKKDITRKVDFVKGTVSSGIDSMKNAISRKVNFVKGTVASGISNMSKAISVKVNFVKGTVSSALGKVKNLIFGKANGGAFYGGSWHDIPQYASGGSPSHGTAFVAGEAGPEVVGNINGRTEVLNKSQIASAIYSATYSAMLNAMTRMNFNTKAASAIPPKAVVDIDFKDITMRLDKIMAMITALVAKNNASMTTQNNGKQQIVKVTSKDRTIFELVIEQGKLQYAQTGRNPFNFA